MSKFPFRQDREELKALLQQYSNLQEGLSDSFIVVKEDFAKEESSDNEDLQRKDNSSKGHNSKQNRK